VYITVHALPSSRVFRIAFVSKLLRELLAQYFFTTITPYARVNLTARETSAGPDHVRYERELLSDGGRATRMSRVRNGTPPIGT